MKRIYLDHSATTPVDPQVLKAMMSYFSDKFGNASSIHSYGQEARASVDQARETVANFLNCKTTEIIFTSGGSESDNLAIKGLIEAISSQNHKLQITDHKQIPNSKSEKLKAESYKLEANPILHVITSAFEHHAVFDTVKELEKEGKVEATYVVPGNDGIVTTEEIKKAVRENTVLVSIMYVNNEIGTLQPIREIGKIIEKINLGRFDMGKGLERIYFHTDAVQAAEYFNMDVNYLHVDLLTFSAHKIYGPKGTGVLYARKGTPLKHQIVGGGQEYKIRAGTENVAGIVGLAEAVKQITNHKSQITNIKNLRDKLIKGIEKNISACRLNGSSIDRSPNNISFSFKNAEGESILLNLDSLGIAASSGSACTSGSLEPSHVLLAIGTSTEEAHGSIRFTLGRGTTEEEIDYVIKVLPDIIKKLRKMSPYK